MGRGKSKSVYNTPYSEQENHAVDNRVYMTKQHELTVGMREEKEKNDGATEKTDAYNKHSSKFYTKYFRDSSNNIRVTRIASTVKGTQAVKKFFTLVNKYETDNNILLSELSKEELMFRMLDRIEKTGTVLELADDIRQFLTYRFKLPDELRLYLYKAFYPRIFDFNENKEFHSEYIRENFDSIYRQIEERSKYWCMIQ